MYDQQKNIENEAPLLTNEISSRRDIVKLYAVELAINLKEVKGTQVAAAYLKRHDVGLEIALRTLLRPTKRRYLK